MERANRTLQDRLVKEMRLEGISDIAAGNAFLPGFAERHNARFAKTPARPDDRHRPLNVPPDRLADILCLREQRYVTGQLTFTHQRQRIMLEETELTRRLAGKYVDTYAFPDGRYEVRHKGVPLAYRVFDLDQRVASGVVTGRKELGAALAHIQELQAAAPTKPARRVPINKQATQYQPTGRRALRLELQAGQTTEGPTGRRSRPRGRSLRPLPPRTLLLCTARDLSTW